MTYKNLNKLNPKEYSGSQIEQVRAIKISQTNNTGSQNHQENHKTTEKERPKDAHPIEGPQSVGLTSNTSHRKLRTSKHRPHHQT